jgi:hypothetical protein
MAAEGRTATLVIVSVCAGMAAVIGLVAWQVSQGQRLPEGPVAVAWEKEACAHCHMQVSEKHFAAQLQTAGGDVLNFDDPGCFLSYVEDERPDIHEVWFHHWRDERWLRRGEVGFVEVPATPMNFGLAAVDRGEPDALAYEQARARILKQRAARG